jgi:hypothetical protein
LPTAGLTLSGNVLYGTTYGGGSSGSGTIFSYLLPSPTFEPLQINVTASNIVISWPADGNVLRLQSSTNLANSGPWGFVSTPPVVVNGQNIVTNAIEGGTQFFRLQISAEKRSMVHFKSRK